VRELLAVCMQREAQTANGVRPALTGAFALRPLPVATRASQPRTLARFRMR